MTSIAHGGPTTRVRRRRSRERPQGGWRLWFRVGLALTLLIGAGFGAGTAVGYVLVKAFTLVHLGDAP
ncbi:hypothetical protein KRR39_03000 [Nocardioides panacis]|uniref:Uncharacterized protein n=1 Tax=Nocardioides panacis TaxID=2849501 RepID=A0A975SZJ4_9ACTN|nr:hypothetical protein [Nocardioides panacis]QWZ08837.1 hypothetical protein KRR39_03000 [Nocardioides panacis]